MIIFLLFILKDFKQIIGIYMYKNSLSNCKLLLKPQEIFYSNKMTLSMLDLHESISCTLKNFSISEKWRVIMNFISSSLFSKCCTLNINIFFFIFRLLKSSEREFVCNLIRWPVKYSKEISKCWPSGNRWLYNHCLQVEINNLPEAYGSLDWFMLFSKML